MRYSVATSNPKSWFVYHAKRLVQLLDSLGDAALYESHDAIPEGDIAYFLSYERIVPPWALERHRNNIVVHASALPKGKGMSPLTWQILQGKNEIPISLFEAIEGLDAGPVYMTDRLKFVGNELLPEMQSVLGGKIVQLCFDFARQYPAILSKATEQSGTSSFYRRRTPADSELDPHKSIAEQFDLLRTVDNDRYPAFFRIRNRCFKLTIEAVDE